MKKHLLILGLLLVVTVAFFSLTSPDNLPVGWLMVPVLLIFGICSMASYVVIKLILPKERDRKHRRSVSILVGITASLILLFQSTGGIVAADVLLMALILVIAYIYINKF